MAHYITSDALQPFAHGFFGRDGGVSSGIYASLNCGVGSDDNAAFVQQNRKIVCAALQAERIITQYQVHSSRVVTITDANQAQEKADAMVTALPGLAIGVLTADCGPLLFADNRNKVIGCAHAGWKGALLGVIASTITAMEALGAEREHIAATLGPCIAQASYQVDNGFMQPFLEKDKRYNTCFVPCFEAPETHHRFDLKGFIRMQLEAEKLGQVEILPHDTYTLPEQFFSFRRTTHNNEPDYGRQISAICI